MEQPTRIFRDRGARLVAVAFSFGLFGTAAYSGTTPSVAAASFALCASIFCALVVWRLLEDRVIPAAALVIMFALAYVPSTWDAIALGFPRTYLRITPQGVRWALVSFLAQIALTALAGWWASRSQGTRAACGVVLSALDPATKSSAFGVGFMALLGVTFLSSVADGQWTSYAPGYRHFDEMSLAGGFRLALFYSTWLLGACALIGSKISQAKTAHQRRVWWVLAGVVFLLIFLLQGRRLMLSGAAFLALPLLIGLDTAKIFSLRSRAVGLLSIGAVLSVLFYGSLVWRVALSRRADNTVAHLRGMANTKVGAGEAVENVRDRLNYLWMDSVAMELGGRRGSAQQVENALMAQVVGNIPGALYPDKYKWKSLSCEMLIIGGDGDLPCTAFGEGILLGGTFGLSLAALAWAVAVAVGSALYATGTHAGRVMSAIFLTPLTQIETQAFPILTCFRSLIITAAILGPIVWLVTLIGRSFWPAPREPNPGHAHT